MTTEVKNVYVTYGDNEYYGFTGYIKDKSIDGSDLPDFIFANNYSITNQEYYSIPQQKKIPRGSSIYLHPGCPYPIDDIRKYYKIKHKPEAADYVVLSPMKNSDLDEKTNFGVCDMIIIPKEKKVFFYPTGLSFHSIKDIIKIAKEDIAGYDENDYIVDSYNSMRIIRSQRLRNLLDGNFNSNEVWYTALDITSENEITVEMLNVLHKVISENTPYEENAIIQMNVLNQHNWRERTGTISFLFSTLPSYSVFARMSYHASRYSKAVQEMLKYGSRMSTKSIKFCNEEDYKLTIDYINNLMGIGNGRVCSFAGLAQKLKQEKIDAKIFNDIFNIKLKIDTNTYDNYIKKMTDNESKED